MLARDRINRFVRNFIGALGHCALEDMELFVPVLSVLACAGLLVLFFNISYDLILDSDSANVASRLAQLSIDPSKWS